MKYKFLKDCRFSNDRINTIRAKKGEEHEVAEHIVVSLEKQGAIKSSNEDEKKTPVEKREKKVVEPEVKKSTKKSNK